MRYSTFSFDDAVRRQLTQQRLSDKTIEKLRHACIIAMVQGWYEGKPAPTKAEIRDWLKDCRESAKTLHARLSRPKAALASDLADRGINLALLQDLLKPLVDAVEDLLHEVEKYKSTGKAPTLPVRLISNALPESIKRSRDESGQFKTIVDVCFEAMKHFLVSKGKSSTAVRPLLSSDRAIKSFLDEEKKGTGVRSILHPEILGRVVFRRIK